MSKGKKMLRPVNVNRDLFTTEIFPKVVGFCDRDDSTFTISQDQKSCTYKLNGEVIYEVIKHPTRWELIEYLAGKITCYSRGHCLQVALFHGLSLAPNYNNLMSDILVPVSKGDKDKALALMYYFGGHTGSWRRSTPEVNQIKSMFSDPDLDFLGFSKVPKQYLYWLGNIFVEAGITGQNKNRIIWIHNGKPESAAAIVPDGENKTTKAEQETGSLKEISAKGQTLADELVQKLSNKPKRRLKVELMLNELNEALKRVARGETHWDKRHKPDQQDTASGENKKAVDELEEFIEKHPQRWVKLRTDAGLILWRERNMGKVVISTEQKHK